MSSHRNRGASRAMALLCGISATAVSSYAIAQEQNSGTEEKGAMTEVVVTGSRIIRAGYDTLEPASVVSGEYIESRGLTNIADALNESPGFGTGVTPEGGQSSFGPGLNFVNRFGLGSNRTLTLIADDRRIHDQLALTGSDITSIRPSRVRWVSFPMGMQITSGIISTSSPRRLSAPRRRC